MQRNRVFGGRCCESLASFDRELSSWRTYQISFAWGDSTFSDPLPQSGIMQNGQLYPLECSERLISEKDGFASAILPTPTTTQRQSKERTKRAIELGKKGLPLYTRRIDETGRKIEGARTFSITDAIIHREMLPTPTADQRVQRYAQGGRSTLCAIVEMLPTPTMHLSKEQGGRAEFQRKSPTLITKFIDPDMDIGERPMLSPHFVTWMMGFPIDWLD